MFSCLKKTKARIFFFLNLTVRIFSSAGKTLLFEQIFTEICCVETDTYRRQKKPHLFNCFSSVINIVAESSSLILAISISEKF